MKIVELAKDKLGVVGSTMMGIAGTAPAFSIEVTMSTFILAVDIKAPASILYCGIVMIGIVF